MSVFSCQSFHCSINIINISTRGRQEPCDNAATLPVIYYSLLDYDNGFDLNSSQRGRAWTVILSVGDLMRARTGLGECMFCQHVDVVINVTQKRQTRDQILFIYFFLTEWLQALIYCRRNMTVHSGVITFRAAVRFCAQSGKKVPQAWKLAGKTCLYPVLTLKTIALQIHHNFNPY